MGKRRRAVTAEAGVTKGVLHRHFADFDDFLAEFVLSLIDRMDPQATALREAAGTGTVVGNLTGALTALFESAAVAIVALVTFGDELRARLRQTWPAGVPVLTDAVVMIASYLTAERDRGRILQDADIDVIAPTLVGTAHLLFADRKAILPQPADVRTAVSGVMASVLREPP